MCQLLLSNDKRRGCIYKKCKWGETLFQARGIAESLLPTQDSGDAKLKNNISALEDLIIIQDGKTHMNENKIHPPGQHKIAVQGVRAVGVQMGETTEDFVEEVRLSLSGE